MKTDSLMSARSLRWVMFGVAILLIVGGLVSTIYGLGATGEAVTLEIGSFKVAQLPFGAGLLSIVIGGFLAWLVAAHMKERVVVEDTTSKTTSDPKPPGGGGGDQSDADARERGGNILFGPTVGSETVISTRRTQHEAKVEFDPFRPATDDG